MILLLATHLAAVWTLLLLCRRLLSDQQALAKALREESGGPDWNTEWIRSIRIRTRDQLLIDTDGKGIGQISVQAREHHDPYHNLQELLDFIHQLNTPSSLTEFEQLIKALYQTQATLDLPDQDLSRFFDPLTEYLLGQEGLSQEIGGLEQLHRGDLVDRDTMWPLSHGTRVSQPLGVVVRDEAGKVISRAKVLCH